MKVVRSQGVLSSAEILRTRGVLQMRTSALFGAKNRFFEIWCVRTDKERREVNPVWTIYKQEVKVVNISRFCADVFYGRLLI